MISENELTPTKVAPSLQKTSSDPSAATASLKGGAGMFSPPISKPKPPMPNPIPQSASTGAVDPDKFHPAEPQTLKETGLTEALLASLVFKHLFAVGENTGRGVARALAMPGKAVLDVLADMKNQRLCFYKGSGNMGDFMYALTEEGRDRAKKYMEESMYVGAAPVSLEQYAESVKAQTINSERPTREDLDRAFSDLLVNDGMFERLGPAINSARGMFLYGYPGNGKSSIAERVTACFESTIWVPFTLIVDGTIIKFYDPEVHRAVRPENSILKTAPFDPRWIEVRRPTIIVGGELTMGSLELQYDPYTKVTEPSVQLKSNCGTLVIDDFGRQRMDPTELLNRWIVPLEMRHDYLTLASGKKIQVPFDQLIIFSTNLEPKDLVDDAFLRRIPYKINVDNPSEEEFRELFRIMARILEIPHVEAEIDYLIETHYKPFNRPFRCCQPRDLLLQIKNRSSYLKIPREMNHEAFDAACDCYFSIM
jgi:hypothetical protein